MNKDKFNLNDQKIKSAYRVPDGYFSDLNHKILHATSDQVEGSQHSELISQTGWRRYFRLAGFALSFAVMVISFTWGFKAITQRFDGNSYESTTAAGYDLMLLSMYDISSNDIITTYQEQINIESDSKIVLTDYDNFVIDQAGYDICIEEIMIESY